MASAADVLIDGLARRGVRHLFGMPGSHSTTIYDAIARNRSIATVLVRNEQSGAFAADGYARVTGRPGVVCTTAGPGATNALTGVAECWADSIPILLIAGQVNADRIDQECGAYHEIGLESIFRTVTKWCGTLRDVADLPSLIDRAFSAMTTGRPRPAAVFLPQDLMLREARFPTEPASAWHAEPPAPDPQVVVRAAELLARAERPILLAGGGALWGHAAPELRLLAERLRCPIVTSLNGKGIFDERDPISLGHARSARAKVALAHADAMLAVGCRFTEVMTGWRRMPVPERLVQIDLDPTQIGMNHPVAVGIVADARTALRALLDALPAGGASGWEPILAEARAARPPRPEWLIDALRAALPDDVPLFTDACEMGYRLHTDWVATGPRRFFYPSNYITLGWGVPAALGAAVARGGGAVAVVSGDGGFVATAQELATAARYGLRVIAIVHNDSTYGAIKNIQERSHDNRYLDVDLNNPDLPQLAASFGVAACRARDAADLHRTVCEALYRPGPTLIEVPDRWRYFRS
jgi:acetolactate synthase-1/2/3 large subunit